MWFQETECLAAIRIHPLATGLVANTTRNVTPDQTVPPYEARRHVGLRTGAGEVPVSSPPVQELTNPHINSGVTASGSRPPGGGRPRTSRRIPATRRHRYR